MRLTDDGWTEEQTVGLLDRLNLGGGIPEWAPNYLQKLRNWCADHRKDWTTIDAQLEFVAYELCQTYQSIGTALKQAETVQEAREAVEPYIRVIHAPLTSRGPRLPHCSVVNPRADHF
jgi:tail lysozyme